MCAKRFDKIRVNEKSRRNQWKHVSDLSYRGQQNMRNVSEISWTKYSIDAPSWTSDEDASILIRRSLNSVETCGLHASGFQYSLHFEMHMLRHEWKMKTSRNENRSHCCIDQSTNRHVTRPMNFSVIRLRCRSMISSSDIGASRESLTPSPASLLTLFMDVSVVGFDLTNPAQRIFHISIVVQLLITLHMNNAHLNSVSVCCILHANQVFNVHVTFFWNRTFPREVQPKVSCLPRKAFRLVLVRVRGIKRLTRRLVPRICQRRAVRLLPRSLGHQVLCEAVKFNSCFANQRERGAHRNVAFSCGIQVAVMASVLKWISKVWSCRRHSCRRTASDVSLLMSVVLTTIPVVSVLTQMMISWFKLSIVVVVPNPVASVLTQILIPWWLSCTSTGRVSTVPAFWASWCAPTASLQHVVTLQIASEGFGCDQPHFAEEKQYLVSMLRSSFASQRWPTERHVHIPGLVRPQRWPPK